MLNGDFLEGDFQGMDTNTVRLSSILFGNHKVARERVQLVLLRAVTPGTSDWKLVTRSGSLVEAGEVRVQDFGLRLRTMLPSEIMLPYSRISQLTRGVPGAPPPRPP